MTLSQQEPDGATPSGGMLGNIGLVAGGLGFSALAYAAQPVYTGLRRVGFGKWPTHPLADEWLADVAANNRPATVQGYRSFMASFEPAFPLLPIAPRDLNDWLNEQGAAGSKTRDNAWRRASVFLRWCERVHDIPHPMGKLRKPRVRQQEPRSFAFAEVSAIVGAVESDWERAAVALYLGVGLRLSEGTTVLVGDVGPDALLVREGKERSESVPLTDALRADLLLLMKGRPDNARLLGCSNDTAARRLKGLYERAGIHLAPDERIGAHALRHTFMTLFQEAGGNGLMADAILRHSRSGMAHHYSHFSKPALRSALAEYGPLAFTTRG